jgi:hypothetical protein
MNETLPGGAGTTVNAMVTQWTFPPQPGSPPRDDYAAVTLGQLKATALPFYQRLHALGYITQNDYLWAQNTTAPFHANVANIGQAKNLFAFALPTAGIRKSDGMVKVIFPRVFAAQRHRFPTQSNSIGQLNLDFSELYNLANAGNGWNLHLSIGHCRISGTFTVEYEISEEGVFSITKITVIGTCYDLCDFDYTSDKINFYALKEIDPKDAARVQAGHGSLNILSGKVFYNEVQLNGEIAEEIGGEIEIAEQPNECF